MPVDASIYNFTPYKFSTLADLADATAKRKDIESQAAERQSVNALRTYTIQKEQQQAQQAAQKSAAVQAALQKHTKPDGSIDQEGLLSDVRLIDLDTYKKLYDGFNAEHKQKIEDDKAKRDADQEEGQWVSSQLRDTLDHPELYPTARATVLKRRPDLAPSLPETPDPIMLGHIIQAPLSNAQYLDNRKAAESLASNTEGQVLAGIYAADTPEQVKDAFDAAEHLGVSKRLAAKGFSRDTYQPTPENKKRALMSIPGVTPDALAKIAAPDKTTAAQGFSLGPNQIRFDAQGKEIARGVYRPQASGGGSAAGASGGSNSDAVQEYAEGLKTGQINITAVPSAGGVRNAVMSSLRKEGYDLSRPLTAQTQARVEFSKAVLPQVQQVADMARQIDKMGLMGSVNGRWRQLISSEGGASSMSGLTPDQKRVVGQFITQAGLLNSGMAMAHGGARGGGSVQMVAQMEKLLDPKNKDLQTFLGNLDAAQNVLGGYAAIKVGNAADSPTPAAAAGGKTVTAAELQAIAKKRGTTVEQETQRYTAGGYTVR